MKDPLRLGVLAVLLALVSSACSGSAAGGSGNQQAEGRPLPKYEQASLPAGRYHTTEFEPSFSFRISGDDWRFQGPSGALGDPEHPDYLFFQKVTSTPNGLAAEIAFFNVRKVKGVYKPRGPEGTIERVSDPDELVEWFQHHPYLKTSEPEPATVGGAKGVQFDVVLANQPANHKGVCGDGPGCQDIFALSTGGSSEVFHEKEEHYIVLRNVQGVPVVIYYNAAKDDYDEYVPVAKKVLQSVEWTDT
jgi:hypothetical protein